MYFKNPNSFHVLLLSVLILSACSSVKNVAYFQKVGTQTDSINQNKNTGVHRATIKPLDLLTISVVTSQPETSRTFNLLVPQLSENSATSLASTTSLTATPALQPYLVDEDGNIDFPVFGKLQVKGLTRKELESVLQEKLSMAFSKERPIITIRIINFTVDVVGEVVKPGKYSTTNERLTIFDGLALAGDMTVYGRRDNVKVLRENADGTKKYITVNLNDENIIHSPGYYLGQNDVVYVEPNKAKSNSSHFGAAESFGISALSIVISLTTLGFTILK